MIGNGTKIFLVQKRSDGQTYAMKSIWKDTILLNKNEITNEILMKAQHPFLLKTWYVF